MEPFLLKRKTKKSYMETRSQATCLVEVDKVDNSVEKVDNKTVENIEEDTNNVTPTVETEKASPIALLILGPIILLIWVGK